MNNTRRTIHKLANIEQEMEQENADSFATQEQALFGAYFKRMTKQTVEMLKDEVMLKYAILASGEETFRETNYEEVAKLVCAAINFHFTTLYADYVARSQTWREYFTGITTYVITVHVTQPWRMKDKTRETPLSDDEKTLVEKTANITFDELQAEVRAAINHPNRDDKQAHIFWKTMPHGDFCMQRAMISYLYKIIRIRCDYEADFGCSSIWSKKDKNVMVQVYFTFIQ